MSSAEHDLDSTLSSLFILRDDSEPITLPPCARSAKESTPQNKSSTRRLLSTATSIAAICVREPTKEVFACSLSISRDSLEIYLAENRAIDPATMAYLDGLLTGLVDVSEESFSEHVMGTLAVVLEFTLPKFLDAISRSDEDWDARMASTEKLDLSEHEKSALLDLRDRITYVCVTAEMYASQRSDKTLRELTSGLGYLRALVFEAPEKDVVAEVLEKVDAQYFELDDEAVMTVNLDPGSSVSQGFSLTRYVARMLSVMVHVMRLVQLAVSPTYKYLFTRTRPPIVHYLVPVPKSVLIDTGAALQFLYDSLDDPSNTTLPSDIFSSADSAVRRIEECAHAEITLFERLLIDALQGAPGGYWVIGTSKLMCAGCYATIARAYPKVLQDDQLTTLKPFLVHGSHGKLESPWIPPDLSNLDKLVGFDFDRRVKAATLDILTDDLMVIVRSRHSARKAKLKLFTDATEEADFVKRMRERIGKT